MNTITYPIYGLQVYRLSLSVLLSVPIVLRKLIIILSIQNQAAAYKLFFVCQHFELDGEIEFKINIAQAGELENQNRYLLKSVLHNRSRVKTFNL